MIQTVAASVLELVERIDAIERETESIYLRLGKVFLDVKRAVDESGRQAESAIEAVLGQHRVGFSAEAARRRSEEFIEEATQFFERASRTERSFLAGVDDGIGSLSQLEDIIGRIRADSEEMEIVSINAMTVALKSGTAGRAFSVITDELKRLSGRTIRHADDLSEAGSALLERLAALKETLGELSAAQSSFFETAKAALEGGFGALDREVDAAAHDLRSLAERASGVRAPIAAIMQEVQLQDIIRQSLDHVRLSLNAAEPDARESGQELVGPEEESAFLVAITRLSASLLDDVSGQVRASLARFTTGISGVNAVMDEVEASRRGLIARRGSDSVDSGFEAKTEAYIRAKERAIAEASAISDGVRRLDERFKEMNAILSRFKNIVTASRIETARNRALSIVSNTVGGMMDLTERLSEDVSAAGGVTRSFAKALSTGMSDYLAGADDSLRILRGETANLRSEYYRILESRSRLWQTEADFRPFSEGFSRAMEEAAASTDRVGTLAGELEEMRDALLSYAAATAPDGSQALAASLDDVPTAEIHSERLRAIVDRFTIFAHKQTAARVAAVGTEVDDSSADSGDVTLF